jgi:hypothetical protein
VRQPSRARPTAATRITQIGQKEPLAPAAAQIPTHSNEAIAAAPARWARRARDRARGILGAWRRRRRQVVEQARELALGAGGVRGVEALVELLGRQPPSGPVIAEHPCDALAVGVGGADCRLTIVHRSACYEPRPGASVAAHTTG